MEHKRICISCRELKNRDELIKITKESKSGNIVIQPNSKTFGRSVYLCYNQECINNAFKKNKLNKILKTGENIEKEILLGLTKPVNIETERTIG